MWGLRGLEVMSSWNKQQRWEEVSCIQKRNTQWTTNVHHDQKIFELLYLLFNLVRDWANAKVILFKSWKESILCQLLKSRTESRPVCILNNWWHGSVENKSSTRKLPFQGKQWNIHTLIFLRICLNCGENKLTIKLKPFLQNRYATSSTFLRQWNQITFIHGFHVYLFQNVSCHSKGLYDYFI